MKGTMTPGSHAVFVLVTEFAEAGFSQLVAEHCGASTLRKTAGEVKASNRTLVEYAWNHTTLHAKKVDKGLTYIRSGFAAGQHLAQAQAARRQLGDEVLVHLEFIRTREGAMTCSGLQLVRYSTDERLDASTQAHPDAGVYIANPHVWDVEDGKQCQPCQARHRLLHAAAGPGRTAEPRQAQGLGTARAVHGRCGSGPLAATGAGDAAEVLRPA
jgi:hypothetical protein